MQENKEKKDVYVIPHTHWDLEWYFDIEKSNILLIHNIDSVLDMLENDDNFKHYTLDGQMSLFDIYLKYRPENKQRIIKLVKNGRLVIGPWFSQTNQNTLHGEAIVRNLLLGIEKAEKFGWLYEARIYSRFIWT